MNWSLTPMQHWDPLLAEGAAHARNEVDKTYSSTKDAPRLIATIDWTQPGGVSATVLLYHDHDVVRPWHGRHSGMSRAGGGNEQQQ
jgi:hypothetical protein